MWYFFDYNPEPEVFKVIDQTKKLHGKAVEIREEFLNIFYDEKLSDENSILDFVEIKSSSIFTDILWDYLFQGEIKIVSEKVVEILSNFNIFNVKHYKTIVKKGKVEKIYFSLRGYGEIYNFINYETSSFSWYKTKYKEREIIKFKNSEEYLKISKKVGPIDSINPVEIFLSSDFIEKTYDMIPLGYLKPCSFIISERLKNELEAKEVVGFEFKPCDFIMTPPRLL